MLPEYREIIGVEDPELVLRLEDLLVEEPYTIRWFTESDIDGSWVVALDGFSESEKKQLLMVSCDGVKLMQEDGSVPYVTDEAFELGRAIRSLMAEFETDKLAAALLD